MFALVRKQDKTINTVAIQGSKNSYFVGRFIHDTLYKYERNLTLDELKNVANNEKIAMFTADENLNCLVVEDDAECIVNCLDASVDETLIPVYYQLSQAENEKYKRAEILVEEASAQDCQEILEIEQSSISVNTLSKQDIETALCDKNYKTFKVLFNKEIAGFVILQITDEANVLSVAVKKEYRNLGLATKLIERVEEYSKSVNLNTLSLEVNYNNITAFLLYKKLGFIERRVRKNYYADGADCIEMVKVLN